MLKLTNSSIGWLRMVGFLEGMSLLLLLFIAVPLKYYFQKPEMVKIVGSFHGFLFILFLVIAIFVSFQKRWNFFRITWKVLIASFIPFGTMYVDYKILKGLDVKNPEIR